jgi:hypothetical protein
MNIHRPANTNTLPAESHSHDEVGFNAELAKAEQTQCFIVWCKKRDEEMKIPGWEKRFSAELRAMRKAKQSTDEQFDADYERNEGWAYEGDGHV